MLLPPPPLEIPQPLQCAISEAALSMSFPKLGVLRGYAGFSLSLLCASCTVTSPQDDLVVISIAFVDVLP